MVAAGALLRTAGAAVAESERPQMTVGVIPSVRVGDLIHQGHLAGRRVNGYCYPGIAGEIRSRSQAGHETAALNGAAATARGHDGAAINDS